MKKVNIILDLDNSLISSIDPSEFESLSTENRKTMMTLPHYFMDTSYIIFERPCLQPFLDYIFDNFNVSVWSAASKDYVLFIVDHVILKNPKRQVNYIFYAYHCDLSESIYGNPKKLDMLWNEFGLSEFNSKNTILVDDLDDVALKQKCNVFHIAGFDIDEKESEKDNHLCSLLKKIKNVNAETCPVKQLQ